MGCPLFGRRLFHDGFGDGLGGGGGFFGGGFLDDFLDGLRLVEGEAVGGEAVGE